MHRQSDGCLCQCRVTNPYCKGSACVCVRYVCLCAYVWVNATHVVDGSRVLKSPTARGKKLLQNLAELVLMLCLMAGGKELCAQRL